MESKTQAGSDRRRPSGMTLIELLIGLAVSSVVMLAFLSLFATSQKMFQNQEARATALEDSRFPIRWLTTDINSAVGVLTAYTFDSETYTSGDTCIILKVPGIDPEGIIIDIEANFDIIIYTLDEENPRWLWRIVDAEDGVSSRVDGARVINDNIQSLMFDYRGADGMDCGPAETEIVNLAFLNVRDGVGKSYQEHPSLRIRLRNRPLE